MADRFVIEGLPQLRAQLRAVADASIKEISTAAKPAAEQVTARAVALIPKKTGAMAGTAKPISTSTSFGVRFSHVGAPVQEFADHVWLRRARQSQDASPAQRESRARSVTRGQKNYAKHGGSVGGADPVDYTNLPATPRFATRAIQELGDKLSESVVWPRIIDVLKAHGWFEE